MEITRNLEKARNVLQVGKELFNQEQVRGEALFAERDHKFVKYADMDLKGQLTEIVRLLEKATTEDNINIAAHALYATIVTWEQVCGYKVLDNQRTYSTSEIPSDLIVED